MSRPLLAMTILSRWRFYQLVLLVNPAEPLKFSSP